MEKTEFETIVKQIAAFLGYEVVIKDFASITARLTKGGDIIDISNPNYPPSDRSKLVVSGVYPRDCKNAYVMGGSDGTVTIKVSATKPVAQIVRDIQKRFMPEYGRLMEVALKRIESVAEYEVKRKANLERLWRPFGFEPTRGKDGEWTLPIYRMSNYLHEFRVSKDTVDMKFWSLPVAVAEKILIILKEAGSK